MVHYYFIKYSIIDLHFLSFSEQIILHALNNKNRIIFQTIVLEKFKKNTDFEKVQNMAFIPFSVNKINSNLHNELK